MFKSDKKEVFSFRKYKGYGLASAVIAAFFFASSVSADVVNNGDGTTTLSNDKASTVVDTAKFKDNTDKTATEIFNEGGYEAEAVTTGTDAVASEVSTKVSYETEDGTKIDNDVSETSTITKDVDYKFTGKSGKEYVGTDAPSTVNQDLGKKDQIEHDGKKYEYVRTETTAGESTGLTNTSFNDVTTKASVEGMYNQDGSIKYDRIKNGSRVWVLEELADGSYGNYVLIENAQNLDDAAIKEAVKTATKKFSKAEVDAKGGFKDTDSVAVYETNTYASRNVKKSVVGHELDYGFTAMGASMYKPVIDDIYSTGLVKDLTKQGDVYYYKGARVYTDGDVVTGERPPVEYSEIEDGKAFASMGGRNTSYDLKPDYPFVDRGGYNFYTPFQYGHILFDFLSQQNSQVDAMVRKWTHIDNVGDLYLEDALFFGGAASGGTVSARESYYGLMDLVYGWMNEDLATKHNISGDRIHGFSDKSAAAINDRPVSSKKVDFVSNIKKENTNEGSVESKINYEGAFDILDAEIRSEIEATYTKDRAKRVALYMKRFYPGAVESIADFDNISLDEYMRLIPLSEIASRMNGPEAVYSSLTNISKYREMYGFTPIVDGYVASSVYNGDSGISLDSEWHAVRNSPGLVTTTTESFTYHDEITPLRAYRLNADENVVRHIYAEVKKGSVVATYSDEDGNKLAEDVNVKTDEYAGEDYTTEAKTIRPIYNYETVNGLTKITTTTYELIKTPENANGKVVAETTILVPYVYRKVVTVDIKGSVIATYKDEEGNILASEEKVITNQNAGTYYAAAAKDIQASATSKITENGREVTLITYELIKTPDNETGEVVGGETLVVPYVYRKVVTNKLVPNNPPVVEEETLKVTRFHSDTGEELQSDVAGFEDAPKIIGDYQFTGTTETNEAGDVQTHIYMKIQTEVPGDAPSVDVPELKVTRYQTEDGTDIKDSEEGFVNAPNTIGNYQFTGVTNMNEGNDVQTHIYSKIVTEIPSDAPKREPEEIQITLHVDEETGKELVEYDPGLTSPKEIEHYTYTGKTTQEEGIRTHFYKKVITEIPGDAPQVDVPQLKATRYTLDDGTEIKDADEGFVDAPNTIGNYQFTGTTNLNEGGDVQTHIYSKIVTEIPRESLVLDKIEYKMTRYVDEQGQELTLFDFGLRGPKAIEDYVFTGRTDSNKAGDVLTHVYRKVAVESKIPGDAPQYDIPELKVTRHVDEKGKELIETEKGTQPPRKTIGDNEYTGRTTEKDGITTHVYAPIKHEIPGDAPVVDVPELKVTRYVNEKGEEIKESESGFINAPKTIGEYEFTGTTKFNDGKDVQTHIYKLVEKPVTPTPDPKKPETPSPRTPEPKTPETPKPEAPKSIETFKSNDSVVESVDQPQFVKNELPKTGETNSNLALVGVSLLTALGLIGFAKRKRED